MHLADARGRGGPVIEGFEPPPPVRSELGGQHHVDRTSRQRRCGLLQFRQRRPVRTGDLLGQRGLQNREGLAEFHGAALELAQDLEELRGRTLLQLRGDEFCGPPADPLPDTPGGATRHAERERGQLRRAGYGTARNVSHVSIVRCRAAASHPE